MKIAGINTIPGPNVYHDKSVLLMRLHLEELTEVESSNIAGFVERLTTALPGLSEHRCSKGYAGGFIERLCEGTYFGHIVEHVALELSTLAGIEVGYGRTYYAGAPGVYDVVVRYRAEHAMKYLLSAAVELVDDVVNGSTINLNQCIDKAKDIIAETELGPSTQTIVDAAERRGIPWVRLNDASLVQLGYGKYRRLIQAAMTDLSNGISVEISCDKELTKSLLNRALIRVPRGKVVRNEEDAVKAFDSLARPCVVKPLDGRQGKGVSVDLRSAEQIRKAYQIATEMCGSVIVEEYVTGRNYRVLVVNGKMVAAAERIPPLVVGDGKRSIKVLIDQANRDPRRGKGHDKPLTCIKIDEIVTEHLQTLGMTVESVPEAGSHVYLRESVNLSTGGSAIDVTDSIHPEVRLACERAARIIGLDICGIDLVHRDISLPLDDEGAIIEVNAAPGLRMHVFPSEGKPRPVGDAIIEMLYPRGSTGRIPIISITGTNGKTTTARIITHALSISGKNFGLTSTDGIYIGNTNVTADDSAGPISARAVLGDPAIDIAVLETARGGIVRRGLGYDWADVAILTNITADHIGQDGIESVDDIVRIKGLVAERVKQYGTLILNADDSRLVELSATPRVQRQKPRIVYFSTDDRNPVILRHLSTGGSAFVSKDSAIWELGVDGERKMIDVSEIPIALGGIAQFQVANVLAAVAACRATDVPLSVIVDALRTFQSSVNPGRGNLYSVRDGVVMIDYGHNPAAFEAICKFANAWHGTRTTSVITVPGDRSDELVKEGARVAARGFDRLIIREDHDRRGRAHGEVAELMCRSARQEMPHLDCRVIHDEFKALQFALETMMSGELIVHFYEKDFALLREILERYGAKPLEGLPANRHQPAAVQGI